MCIFHQEKSIHGEKNLVPKKINIKLKEAEQPINMNIVMPKGISFLLVTSNSFIYLYLHSNS